MQPKKIACVALCLVFAVLTSSAQERLAPASPRTVPAQGGTVTPKYGNVPLMFEANQGQTDSRVRFFSRGSGYSVFLTSGGMVLALRPYEITAPADAISKPLPNLNHSRPSSVPLPQRVSSDGKPLVLAIDLVGAAANPPIVGEEPQGTRINYFIGRDPSKWRRNVPTYSRIRYRNVYPGVDLVYYGNNHRVEYDFDLAAGADATRIQFSVKGADALTVDAAGNLVLTKGGGVLRFQTPILYQEIKGVRTRVPGTYVLRDSTHVGFEVGAYDTSKPLVIDPVLIYSTFLGGSNDDFSNGIAVDSAGDAYVVGITDSPDFPLATIGPYNSTQFRMFLTKLDPTGSTLLFADYFGGTSGLDEGYAVAVDSSGNAYVTGNTASSDFPVVNAYQPALTGSQDAFLTKFSADGSSIVYSTYLGGANLTYVGGSTTQVGRAVSVDPSGEAVVAGITMATDFPTTNAYQSSASPDQSGDLGEYGFLTKFAPDGTSVVFSTYLAGSSLNASDSCADCFPISEILDVATDASGNAYVTGYTTTTDFPVTPGALTTVFPGANSSSFVSKFTSSGGLAYSTYLGGFISSYLDSIDVDSTGSAYVTGYDGAGDSFPIVTTSICDPSVAACNGAIIAKLDPTGTSLIYSTFLGTSNNMMGQKIKVDADGDAFIVGTNSEFDLLNPIEGPAGQGDAVLAEINPNATTLLMATFLGGQGWEAVSGLALDSSGAAYVTGDTKSIDFPVTQSAFQNALGGQTDTFVSKIDPATNQPAVAMAPFSLQFGSQDIGSVSTAQTTVLRNMGSAALTISSKTIGADFTETDDCPATVAPASFCTFTVTFAPAASGNLMEALTITDNASGSPHLVALSGTGTGSAPNFTISSESNAAVVNPGGTATYQLNVSPTGGSLSEAVTFACNGAPAFAICSVNPRSIILGQTSSTVTVTVQTAARVGAVQPRLGRKSRLFLASWIFAPMGLLGMLLLGRNDRRMKIGQCAMLAVAMIALLCLAGCGGMSAGEQSTGGSNPIPLGTYSLNVVATSGAMQHVASLTLIVQ